MINLSYAAYGQFTYDITERLHFSAGLRRSQEKKEFDTDVSTLFLGIPTLSAHERERFSNWSPMANLKYDLTDDSIVYFTWSRGWKSGGFNGGAFIPEQLEAFQEEDEKSMELGYKGTFFDTVPRSAKWGRLVPRFWPVLGTLSASESGHNQRPLRHRERDRRPWRG